VIQPVPWQVVPLAERRKPAQTPAPEGEEGGVPLGRVADALGEGVPLGEGELEALAVAYVPCVQLSISTLCKCDPPPE